MRLRSAARRLVRHLGYDVIRWTTVDCPERRRQLLLEANDIGMVLDVGANTGQYGRAVRDAGFAGRILSFEPLPGAFARLRESVRLDPAWECQQVALGDADSETIMHVAANSVSSSVLPTSRQLVVAAPAASYIGSVTVPLRRLDTVMGKLTVPEEHLWLKLDVQGYEHAVLDGATHTLRRARVVESELSLATLYEGQRLYREIIDRLDSLGFNLVSIERGFTDPNTGRVLQADGIFERCAG